MILRKDICWNMLKINHLFWSSRKNILYCLKVRGHWDISAPLDLFYHQKKFWQYFLWEFFDAHSNKDTNIANWKHDIRKIKCWNLRKISENCELKGKINHKPKQPKKWNKLLHQACCIRNMSYFACS